MYSRSKTDDFRGTSRPHHQSSSVNRYATNSSSFSSSKNVTVCISGFPLPLDVNAFQSFLHAKAYKPFTPLKVDYDLKDAYNMYMSFERERDADQVLELSGLRYEGGHLNVKEIFPKRINDGRDRKRSRSPQPPPRRRSRSRSPYRQDNSIRTEKSYSPERIRQKQQQNQPPRFFGDGSRRFGAAPPHSHLNEQANGRDRPAEERGRRDISDPQQQLYSKQRDFKRRSRSRSRTPPPSAMNNDVIPLNRRPRRLNNWDVRPPGFEGISADQLKSAGLLFMPGKSLDLGGFTSAQGATISMLFSGRPDPSIFGAPNPLVPAGKENQILYVEGLPKDDSFQESELIAIVNSVVQAVRASEPEPEDAFAKEKRIIELSSTFEENIVVSIVLDESGDCGYIHYNTPVNAKRALTALNHMLYRNSKLTFHRPSGFKDPDGLPIDPYYTICPLLSKQKLVVGNLPAYIQEQHIYELLSPFGSIKHVYLVEDSTFGCSKGFAFVEFDDPSLHAAVAETCKGILEIADCKLSFEEVKDMRVLQKGIAEMMPAMAMLTTLTSDEPTAIVQLLNLFELSDLVEDYEFLVADIREEALKFGPIHSLHIPVPSQSHCVPDVGKVLIHYKEAKDAEKAQEAFGGRKYGEKTVISGFYPSEPFLRRYEK